ncbi:uncharacterized protein LOC124370367 [Homalodisca vitripennis]|uniref:uncharacterized protein LOC124370367 n=1 Tax=Homalodisca vitripennis TaxID=197043 RepID=UPI001EEA7A9A|nr:uncharacterized protein LOC124370367 [Homalodisca vitripennis]
MEPEIPSWLNDGYLATVLQGGENKSPKVTVTNFTTKSALPLDENYGSNIFRMSAEYKIGESPEEHTTSLIIKTPLTKGFLKEYAEKADIFNREQRFYSEVLSQLYKKAQFEFGPKAFYSPDRNRLILQDLKVEGYVMASRAKQLNFSHCKLVMTSIGKYHATSILLHNENSKLVEEAGSERLYYDEGPFKKEVKGWVETSLRLVSDVLKEMKGYEHFGDLMLSKVDGIWEYLVKVFKPRKQAVNVLNHGDLWVNNMLFKYNSSGTPDAVKLVDFQYPRYSSPAVDLIYFIWTSADEGVRETKQEETARHLPADFELHLGRAGVSGAANCRRVAAGSESTGGLGPRPDLSAATHSALRA